MPLNYVQKNDEKLLKFNITSLVPLKQFFTGVVNKKRMLGILSSMAESFMHTDEFMIDVNKCVFDLNYIYVNVSLCKASFICMPVKEYKNQSNISSFLKELICNTHFDEHENCDYVARIISFFNSSETFSLIEFKNAVEALNNENVSTTVKKVDAVATTYSQTYANSNYQVQNACSPKIENLSSNQNSYVATLPKTDSIPLPIKNNNLQSDKEKKSLFSFGKKRVDKTTDSNIPTSKASKINKNIPPVQSISPQFSIPTVSQKPLIPSTPQSLKTPIADMSQQKAHVSCQQPVMMQAGNFGETTVLNLGVCGDTTVLSTENESICQPYLLELKTNQKTYINKPFFRIGKEKSYVDYYLGENTAISRSHADIIVKNNEYYIIDNNSTNHTYVNEQIIQSQVEIKIIHGTKIKLANVELVFYMY